MQLNSISQCSDHCLKKTYHLIGFSTLDMKRSEGSKKRGTYYQPLIREKEGDQIIGSFLYYHDYIHKVIRCAAHILIQRELTEVRLDLLNILLLIEQKRLDTEVLR